MQSDIAYLPLMACPSVPAGPGYLAGNTYAGIIAFSTAISVPEGTATKIIMIIWLLRRLIRVILTASTWKYCGTGKIGQCWDT